MRILAVMVAVATMSAAAQVGKPPDGFTSLFDGKTAKGWHWSRTVHHGTTAPRALTCPSREKGICPGTGCPHDLRDTRARLLETAV